MHAEIDARVHRLRLRFVGEAQPEGAVDLHLVVRVGLGQGGSQVAEAVEDGGELFGRRCRCFLVLAGWVLAAARGCPVALPLRFGDPAGDQARVGTGRGRPGPDDPTSARFWTTLAKTITSGVPPDGAMTDVCRPVTAPG